MDRKPFQRRLASLKQEYESWLPQHKEISKFILPTRGFFSDEPNKAKIPDYKSLIDGTSVRAAGTLAAGMASGLTPRSRKWFKLGLPDPELMEFEPVREWLNEVESRMMSVFAKSNIYSVFRSLYEELGGFGTAATMILEDREDVIRGYSFTSGEYLLGAGSDCRVNTFGREFWMTVGQLVQEYGIDNVSERTRVLYKNDEVDKWIKVNLLIEPNDSRILGCLDFRNMAFRSVHWEEGSEPNETLRMSGFEDFPVLAPRWETTTTSSIYGTGPGWKALGDIRMLQKMQKDKLLGLDKVMNPPVQMDASVQGEGNLLPGGVTRSSGVVPNAGVRAAYQISPDFNAIGLDIREVQKVIKENFYSDLFLMLAQGDQGRMTAKEVATRYEEKMIVLGPVVDNFETEGLDPAIDRTFNIMARPEMGLIPEPPRELQGMDLQVEYISILAQAQKMVGTAAIEQTLQFTREAMAVSPEVADVFDAEEAASQYGKMLGVAPRVIRAKESIDRLRKFRYKAQKDAQIAQAGAAAVQGAQALANTPIGGNSALDAMLGTYDGGGA